MLRTCPKCRAPVGPRDNFCSNCGAQVVPTDPRSEGSAERRLTTALFCDVVGWTSLSERLDPEDLHSLVRSYHEVGTRAINRYGGHVANYLGDGIVAFFGFPNAHEDDSKRAVLAGLAILESMKELNRELSERHGLAVSVRVGIHSGLVIAGEVGSPDRPIIDIIGETPNIAARLQAVAEPDSVVVSAETKRITEQSFQFEALGAMRLKGVTRALEVFRVLGASESPGPARQIVGRGVEIARVHEAWTSAQDGHGRLVLVRGEPGIGKSSLVGEILRELSGHAETATITLRCSPYHQTTPFYPVIEYLRTDQMKIARSDPPDVQVAKMESFVTDRGFEPAEAVPILGPLLSIDVEGRYPAPLLAPEGRRIRTIELILAMTVRRANLYSVVLVLDDLHWADPSTLELFGRVLEHLPELRMLAIATYRPYFKPAFVFPEGTVELELGRLDPASVHQLASQAAEGHDLPAEIEQYIIEKTDGVPLFIEELTKAIIESGAVKLESGSYELAGGLQDLAVPTTLQGSLIARLERAGGRRDIAQVASVIGREFTANVVAAVAHVDEETVARGLSALVSADLIYPIEGHPETRAYRFRHALIQDAAYDSLLKSARQQYHSAIAKTLETQFSETAAEQPELVANHYSSAGAVEAALQWWSRAGQKALGRSANLEAISHFSRGLELLEQMSESPSRIETELAMLAQRGTALIATKGFAAPEVGETFRRAETICQLIGETPLLFPVVWGLWVYHLVRSELEVSCAYAEQMLRLAEMSGESGMFLEGHFALGDSLFWLGRLAESKEHLDQAHSLYDPAVHGSHTMVYGQDPGVTTLCYMSYTYWALGFPDQALAFADEANRLAERTRHPFSIGWGLAFGGMIRSLERRFEEGLQWAERCLRYCTEQGQAFWQSAALAQVGWATFYLGDRAKGLELLRKGLAGYEMTGSIVVTPLLRGVLAEALCEDGQLDEAMSVAEAGLATIREHHEWVTEPYLQRIQGDVHAKLGAVSQARELYLLSYSKAKEQASRIRAVQAAAALVRLDRDPSDIARLYGILGEFTEGFGIADLTEAKDLLVAEGS